MYPTTRPDFAPAVMRRITRRMSSAFTLVELLVVIAILGILMSAITVAVVKVIERVKVARARNEIHSISMAVTSYFRDIGEMPPDTGYGLPTSPGSKLYDPGSLWRHLVKEVRNERTGRTFGPYFSWKRKYMKAYDDPDRGASYLLLDPWGSPYGFVGDPKRVVHQRGSFDLFSAGPDGATACDEPGAAPNRAYDGRDNDGDGTIDDRDEFGPDALRNGDVGDDVNSWSGN